MAHSKETMKRSGKLWHLEDTVSKTDAGALKRHLKSTEEKRVIITPAEKGKKNVWWSKK
jgi:hypothetical protein